ncbi:hypothetical protein DIPPA_07146 [Diplonema papillatum]|nr:hypothetical protein DIPPA_07146 [Diplonema papillatum]
MGQAQSAGGWRDGCASADGYLPSPPPSETTPSSPSSSSCPSQQGAAGDAAGGPWELHADEEVEGCNDREAPLVIVTPLSDCPQFSETTEEEDTPTLFLKHQTTTGEEEAPTLSLNQQTRQPPASLDSSTASLGADADVRRRRVSAARSRSTQAASAAPSRSAARSKSVSSPPAAGAASPRARGAPGGQRSASPPKAAAGLRERQVRRQAHARSRQARRAEIYAFNALLAFVEGHRAAVYQAGGTSTTMVTGNV